MTFVPLPPAADVALTVHEGTGVALSCPADWTGRVGRSGPSCTATGGAACMSVSEVLPEPMSAAAYARAVQEGWDQGFASAVESASDHRIGDVPVHRRVVRSGEMHFLEYYRVDGQTAHVVTCTANGSAFRSLVSVFDAVAQSLRVQ